MKKEHVTLSDEHRTHLQNLIKKGSLSAKTYKRALVLLELDRGRTWGLFNKSVIRGNGSQPN